MSTTIQRNYHRNGLVREEIPLRKGRRQGVQRTWHKNGVLAHEEPYEKGLLHGTCRQWNEQGRLLGQFRMVHGTGLLRAWHDNGQLQMEFSTVRGQFCGRSRIWLRDGTLISEQFWLCGCVVSAADYRAAAARDKTLPQVRGKPACLPPNSKATQKHVFRVFVASLLGRPNQSEAMTWLTANGGNRTVHSLGRFKRDRDAVKFVQQLYDAGATKVIAPDLYGNKAGDQFADCLLVRLPANPAKRKAVRQVCAQLRRRRLGAMNPDADIGETYLYLYLG